MDSLEEDIIYQVKMYVGIFNEKTEEGLKEPLKILYGKNWNKNNRYKRIRFLINSIKLSRHQDLDLAQDIKDNKELYKRGLQVLLEITNEASKKYVDIKALDCILNLHNDIENIINSENEDSLKIIS